MLTKGVRLVTVALLLLLVTTIIFRDFVFGNKLLLYKDIGSDSINFYYSYFVHLSDYLRTNGLPRWSFNVGMGQSIFAYLGLLLFDPVTWLPRHLIAHALVYQHLLKVIVCGLLFFRFLELRGANFTAALLGALLISSSAYMCMGSCWMLMADEVICLSLVLFAVEAALVKGHWIYLPLAVACCGILTPFHLYFAALLLTAYVPARLFVAKQGKWSANVTICLLLAAAALLGVGLAAFIWLDSLALMLASPRGSGVVSYTNKLLSFPIFGLETTLHYFTAILRQFSNEMAGTGDRFRGWQKNYLEAPINYCGLFCLLILPQLFVLADSRRLRVAYGIVLIALVVPVLFPWFRYLFWLFQGDYYRTFSLFSVFAIVTLSMAAFSRYLEQGRINIWLLSCTLFTLVTVLSFRIPGLQNLIDPQIRRVTIFFLVGYTALLVAGRYIKHRRFVAWVIIGLCAIELCYFDRITVADRKTVTKKELRERIGYNDYTIEAVRDLRAEDNGFYRITKRYLSSPVLLYKSLNDALVFGYYGTTSYSSFNSVNYIRFLLALDVIPKAAKENETRWALGLLHRRIASAFACEKYVLTLDPVPFQIDSAYTSHSRYDKVYVFENKTVQPLGIFFESYVPEIEFMQLSTTAKERLLLQAAILPGYDSRLTSGLKQLRLDSQPDVSDRTTLQMESFGQNCIVGEVQCTNPGILIFQTPFDRGWRAFVDEKREATFKADVGLLGIKLAKGKHRVEMRYEPPFLKLGAAVSVFALLLYSFALWRWPRISPALS